LLDTAPTPETVGSIRLQPSGPIVAGARGTWKLIYTAGPSGIEVGGSLRIFPPHQGHTFWELGKVTAETSRPLATCEVETFNDRPYSFHHSQPPYLRVTVYGRPLIEGDTITLTIGEPGGYSRGYFRQARVADHAYHDYRFEVSVDVLGNGARPREFDRPDAFVELSHPPKVDIIAASPAYFHVVARPPGGDDDSFALVVSARDEYTNLAQYQGTLKLECTDPDAELPETIAFSAEDGGCKTIPGCRLSADAARVTVYDPRQQLIGTSNPAAPGFAGEHRVYFGDLHVMTGTFGAKVMLADTEYAYNWARDVQGLDFCAITNGGSEGNWQYDLELDERFNQPGSFATIPALERGWRQGHKNVYYRDASAPAMPRLSIEELWNWLGDRRALVIPHHTNCHSETSRYYAWGPQDWSTHDPRFQRLAEVCQDRGSFELDAVGGNVCLGGLGSSIQDALALGYRLGFVGGTDNHRAQPGSPRSPLGGLDADEIVGGGITAVFAPELTREALWDALHERCCYATTARRILLDVRMGEHMMGSDLAAEHTAPYAGSRTIAIRALGVGDIDRIDIVRNNVTVRSYEIGAEEAELEYADPTPLTEIQPVSKAAAGLVFYYVRVVQSDRNMAWSSPIWLTCG
jgi:hypothetical protein